MTQEIETTSWGLIGCGDIARKRVGPALRDLPASNLIAVNRNRHGLLERFAADFGARRAYRSWKDLLADDEIDAVYVATPVDLHAPITIAAAEKGKHVLCEKPMALNVEQCDDMIRACQQQGVRLGIAYYRHFYPVIQRIKRIISSREIGDVILAQINAFEYFNPKPGEPRSWFLEKKRAGGGPLFDFGCHRIELLMNLLGEIGDVCSFLKRVRFEREVEDTATVALSFSSGVLANVTVTHAAFESLDTLSIFGSKGSIHVPVLNEGHMKVVTSFEVRLEDHPPNPNFHEPLIEDFMKAVIENRQPRVNGGIGREVNRILSEAYK
jgi:predicted dehydrogenase